MPDSPNSTSPPRRRSGQRARKVPCWEWPDTAWLYTGCCSAAAPLTYCLGCSDTCAGAATGSEEVSAAREEEVPQPPPPPSPPPVYTHPVFGTFLPPPPASVMLTFGSKSVSDFILNWCVEYSSLELEPDKS